MDPEDETEEGALASAMPSMNVGDWARSMQGLTAEQSAYSKQRESERAAQYEALRRAIAAEAPRERSAAEKARVAREAGHGENFRLALNNGAGAGQTVFHLHIHVLAGRPFSWPPG